MSGRGWHLTHESAPHKETSITVEPIRKRSDVLKIMQHLKSKRTGNARDYALFTVGVSVGLRAYDLLGLKWRTVLDEDTWEIKRRITLQTHKVKKIKTIVLGPKAKMALEALLPKHKAGEMPDVDLDGFVFASRQDARRNMRLGMSVQRLNQLVKAWTAGVGLKGQFGTHSLRKTFSFHILKNGGDLTALMKLLDHSSPGVTLRYAGIEQTDLDNLVLKLNW
jgi:integrase